MPGYSTLGDLYLRASQKGPVTGYRRQLDLKTGVVRVTYTLVGVQYVREIFASVPQQLIVVHLSSDRKGALSFRASMDRPSDYSVHLRGENTLVLQNELPEHYSTGKSYRSNIERHLKPRWGGDYLLEKIRPMVVEDWLKNLNMASKSKFHIRNLMHQMYQCAAPWELFNEQRNPIALVRVKNCTRRRQRPMILIVESFQTVLQTLKEPYKTMVIIAQ